MNVEIVDIETYKECFILCSFDINTKKKLQFEISFRKNDIEELVNHLKITNGHIGYNNLGFDYPILHWLINNWSTYNTVGDLLNAIFEKSQQVIEEEYSYIPTTKHKVAQLDLYKIWHFDNRAKATSLKQLEFTMRMLNIQDLPYDIYDNLTSDMIDNIIKYCHHDVKATYLFYQLTIGITDDERFKNLYKGKDKISFRKEMSKTYNQDFLNLNDVKIGEEINKLTYLNLTGKTWWDIRNLRTKRYLINIKELIPTYIKFKNIKLQQLYDYLLDKQINCYKPKLEYKFKFANIIWKFKLGGIHTEDSGRIIVPKEYQIFEEKDVGLNWLN